MQIALVSEGLSPTVEPWSSLGYLHRPSTEDEVKGITHWVVADLDTQVCHAFAHTMLLEGGTHTEDSLCWVILMREVLLAELVPSG